MPIITNRVKAQIQKDYRDEVQAHWSNKELNTLLASGRSFAQYDKDRLTMELKEQPEDIAKRPEKILNWRLREFDEQGMLNSVRALEGKKVISAISVVFGPRVYLLRKYTLMTKIFTKINSRGQISTKLQNLMSDTI